MWKLVDGLVVPDRALRVWDDGGVVASGMTGCPGLTKDVVVANFVPGKTVLNSGLRGSIQEVMQWRP